MKNKLCRLTILSVLVAAVAVLNFAPVANDAQARIGTPLGAQPNDGWVDEVNPIRQNPGPPNCECQDCPINIDCPWVYTYTPPISGAYNCNNPVYSNNGARRCRNQSQGTGQDPGDFYR